MVKVSVFSLEFLLRGSHSGQDWLLTSPLSQDLAFGIKERHQVRVLGLLKIPGNVIGYGASFCVIVCVRKNLFLSQS